MVVGEIEIGTDVLIIGSGPAGYTAAIRCGRLGLDATLAGPQLGGVCLHLGCIPVKALMHSLDLAIDARESSVFGVDEQATIDLKRAQEWKGKVIRRLEGGIREMLKESDVDVMEGICSFQSSTTAIVKGSHGSQHIEFKRAVIATGSHFRMPEGIRMDGTRVTNPYGLIQLDKAPRQVVVLGAGLGGLTTASLLAKMGSEVMLVFKGQTPVRAVDDDILQPALQWLEKNKVRLVPGATWQVSPDGMSVKINSKAGAEELKPEKVIFATPQEANTGSLNLNSTKVKLDEKGFVVVDGDFRTADPNIFAIGDVLGGARNASTAFREGLSVANILAGKPGLPDYQSVPYTMYTEPPIAAAGMTENQAREKGLDSRRRQGALHGQRCGRVVGQRGGYSQSRGRQGFPPHPGRAGRREELDRHHRRRHPGHRDGRAAGGHCADVASASRVMRSTLGSLCPRCGAVDELEARALT